MALSKRQEGSIKYLFQSSRSGFSYEVKCDKCRVKAVHGENEKAKIKAFINRHAGHYTRLNPIKPGESEAGPKMTEQQVVMAAINGSDTAALWVTPPSDPVIPVKPKDAITLTRAGMLEEIVKLGKKVKPMADKTYWAMEDHYKAEPYTHQLRQLKLTWKLMGAYKDNHGTQAENLVLQALTNLREAIPSGIERNRLELIIRAYTTGFGDNKYWGIENDQIISLTSGEALRC